jgi:predicted acyltransferase
MDNNNKNKRLLSLDALRGFDMLFIMGMSGLIVNLSALLPDCAFAEWIAGQMKHVAWDGFAHHDTIFPLFLFIAGVSFPFSLSKQREVGLSNREIVTKILRRAAILILLGVLYNGFFKMQFETLRFPSVLGRIGIAWAGAALLTLYLKPKARAIICTIILVGYSLLLTIPAPDAMDVDVWTKQGNIAGYIDRVLMPNHILWRGVMDPEGLLSNLPAVVTAMLGIFTGEYLLNSSHSGKRKAATMAISAVILLVTALIWNYFQPINKTLWSSAFVLAAGAYSLIMFALFYYIIDVQGYKRWCYFFKVVGVNSITIYLAQRFINFGDISRYFTAGLATHLPDGWGAVLISVGYITACWLLLYFLDRKGVYLKV